MNRECMECGEEVDLLAELTECCPFCGSDEISTTPENVEEPT